MSVFPWKCCSVCGIASEECSSLYITKPCAHFVCYSCRERSQPGDCCPSCRAPARFEDPNSEYLRPFIDDVLDSAGNLQNVLGLQNKHYLQSCAREKGFLSASESKSCIPISKLEKETLQFERKVKQMRTWKNSNATVLSGMDAISDYLMKTCNLQHYGLASI